MVDAPPNKPCVLVVDDNEQNRALARATLEDDGFEVQLAGSGPEALALFTKRIPDCVLPDIRMPGMDGIETCRRLRGLPGAEDAPVVFLTAARDVDTFDAAQLAGGNDFVTKPVQPTELTLRVQMALRLRRLDASNKEYFELARRQRDDLLRLQLQKERLSSFVVHNPWDWPFVGWRSRRTAAGSSWKTPSLAPPSGSGCPAPTELLDRPGRRA